MTTFIVGREFPSTVSIVANDENSGSKKSIMNDNHSMEWIIDLPLQW